MSETLLRLCRVDEIPADEPLRAEVGDTAYAVFNLDGRYHVMADQCTHGPGYLGEGAIIGTEVECPFHQGRFDIATGAPTAPPCTEPMRVWTAILRDGELFIDRAEGG